MQYQEIKNRFVKAKDPSTQERVQCQKQCFKKIKGKHIEKLPRAEGKNEQIQIRGREKAQRTH